MKKLIILTIFLISCEPKYDFITLKICGKYKRLAKSSHIEEYYIQDEYSDGTWHTIHVFKDPELALATCYEYAEFYKQKQEVDLERAKMGRN